MDITWGKPPEKSDSLEDAFNQSALCLSDINNLFQSHWKGTQKSFHLEKVEQMLWHSTLVPK